MLRKLLRVLLWVAVTCGVIGGLGYLVLEPWTIPGDDPQLAVSIEPTMSAGDLVLVTRSKGGGDGALVRCGDPDAPGRFVVGRVAAHGGDHVEVVGGVVTVNGKSSPASVACEIPTVHLVNPTTQEDKELGCSIEDLAGYHPILRDLASKPERDQRLDVDPGKLFLLSDDRALHLDSRDYLAVPTASCQRIVLRLWGASGWLDGRKRLTVLW